MKIAYFVNSFKSTNWGGQATSEGIKYLLSKEYPEAEFVPIDFPPLKKLKFIKKIYENRLIEAILSDNNDKILKYLGKMNIKRNIFENFTHICFNGEGAIHYKSGHLVRLMGILYLAKIQNKIIASINQTIDLNNNTKLENLVSKIYNMCDFVSVREPISLEIAKNIGINNCKLIPDAVYGLPTLSNNEIEKKVLKYNLPKRYITVAGSSAIKKNRISVEKMKTLLNAINKVYPDTTIVFMASTKTDLYLANKLKESFGLKIISSKIADYTDSISIISKSLLLAGGRQHPNIFAYMHKIPYVGFEGNTFKNKGVAKLQNYPIQVLDWNSSIDTICNTIKNIQNINIKFQNIKIQNFNIFQKE